MSSEPFNVSRVTRELLLEYGDRAVVVARVFIEECRYAGDAKEAKRWEAVRDALIQFNPGGQAGPSGNPARDSGMPNNLRSLRKYQRRDRKS
jgi:hypothetical protein